MVRIASLRPLGIFLATIVLASVPTVRAADFLTYTDKAAFDAAVTGAVTDNFDGMTQNTFFNTPLNRTVGAYQYSGAATNGFYTVGPVGDVWLSTNSGGFAMNFTITSGSPTALGGYFFVTNNLGSVTADTVSVSINSNSFLQSTSSASSTNFFGWVSTNGTPISNFRVTVSGNFATVNNLIFAQAMPVPEPSTYVLGTLAALALGLSSRWRKK